MLRSLRTRGGRKWKTQEYPVQGLKLLPQSYFPITLSSCLATWEPSFKNSGSDFHPRLPFLSLPIYLRHKHIYSFKHLFMFQESGAGRPLYSSVPGRSGCKSDTWHWTRTSLNPTFSPEENRGLSKPINQLSFFLRLLSCRRIDKWQWLQPNL